MRAWTEGISYASCPQVISPTSLPPVDDLYARLFSGGGKSLTYQLPATLVPGCTLVVSPLLALIKDQCLHLQEKHSQCAPLLLLARAGRLLTTLTQSRAWRLPQRCPRLIWWRVTNDCALPLAATIRLGGKSSCAMSPYASRLPPRP